MFVDPPGHEQMIAYLADWFGVYPRMFRPFSPPILLRAWRVVQTYQPVVAA